MTAENLEIVHEIADALKNAENVVLSGHTNPDGDAIGSCLALASALRLMGKPVYVLLEEYSPKYNVIPGRELIYKDEYSSLNPDVFVSLDCAIPDRMGRPSKLFKRARMRICIDHHIAEKLYGHLNYVDREASSTGELVFNLIKHLPVVPDKNIYTAIYAALVSDTGGFRHSSTKKSTLLAAAEIIEHIDFNDVYNELMFRHSLPETKILSRTIEKTTIDPQYPIAYTTLTSQDYADCGATYKDLDGVVEYILGIRGVQVSMLVYDKSEKKPGEVKVSLRSRRLNVSAIASKFGGGGHHLAAGASLTTDMQSAVSIVLDEIKKSFDEEMSGEVLI